jgi:hypothetical protein
MTAKTARLDQPELPARLALTVRLDRPARQALAPQARPDRPELTVLLDCQARTALTARLDLPDPPDQPVILAQLAQQARPELPAQLDCLALTVRRDRPVRQELTALLAQPARQA